MQYTVALFGESGKGKFHTPYYCKTLDQLSDFLGEPPSKDCKGLDFAIQSLLYKRGVVFFRVHEEGFSTSDYLSGLNSLENKELFPLISAIGLPGVGDSQIIQATGSICNLYQSFLILTEKDLYDYLTCSKIN